MISKQWGYPPKLVTSMVVSDDDNGWNVKEPTNKLRHIAQIQKFHTKKQQFFGEKSTHTFTDFKTGENPPGTQANIYNGDVTLGNLFGQAKKLVSPSASRSRGTLNWNRLSGNQHGYQVWFHGTNFGANVFVWLNWHLNKWWCCCRFAGFVENIWIPISDSVRSRATNLSKEAESGSR